MAVGGVKKFDSLEARSLKAMCPKYNALVWQPKVYQSSKFGPNAQLFELSCAQRDEPRNQ